MKWLCEYCGSFKIMLGECKPLKEYYIESTIPEDLSECDECNNITILNPYPVKSQSIKNIMQKFENSIMQELESKEKISIIINIPVSNKNSNLIVSNLLKEDGIKFLKSALNEFDVKPNNKMN